jgi:hypothetical protein
MDTAEKSSPDATQKPRSELGKLICSVGSDLPGTWEAWKKHDFRYRDSNLWEKRVMGSLAGPTVATPQLL